MCFSHSFNLKGLSRQLSAGSIVKEAELKELVDTGVLNKMPTRYVSAATVQKDDELGTLLGFGSNEG